MSETPWTRDYVASTWGGPHEANGRLIAAAPDEDDALLALANEVAGLLGYNEPGLRELYGNTNLAVLKDRLANARAALAKARGEAP